MLLLAIVILAALLIGRLSGGSFGALSRTRIHWPLLAPLALALQVVDVGPLAWQPWILAGSYLLLVVFVVRNLQLGPAVWVMLIGLLMNAVVIAANGGMPVASDAVVSSGQGEALADLVSDADGPKHELLTEETVLPFLADTIALGPPLRMVVSAGDLAFYVGIAWLLVSAMRRERPRSAHRKKRGAARREATAGSPTGSS